MNGCFRKMNSNRKDENSENYKEDQKSEDFTSSIDVISVSDILGTTTNNSVSLMEASSGYSVKAAMPVTRDTVSVAMTCCQFLNIVVVKASILFSRPSLAD